jgi:hypothetical protein
LAVVIIVIWHSRQQQALRQAVAFVIPGVIWLCYVCLIGGDIFPGYRHWLPALVCLAFALSSVTEVASIPLLPLLVLLVFGSARHFALQTADTENKRALLERWEWDGIAVGQLLRSVFGAQQPLVAVDPAGCVPYASQLPSLDMLGLNDLYLARHRPPDMGRGMLGHELGNGPYVLSRKPDLVLFCWPRGRAEPCFHSGIEMAAMSEFRRNYRLMYFRAGNVDASLWARVRDGRLGIVRTTDSIHIPGFLLATSPGVRVVLDDEGRPAVAVEYGTASVENVYIPPGTWRVSLDTNTPDRLQLGITPVAGSVELKPNVLRVVSSGIVRTLYLSGGQGLAYSITARRLSD